MADIQPNAEGKVAQARKRLKKHITDLKNADALTAGQRDVLFGKILLDLCRMELYKLNQLGDND